MNKVFKVLHWVIADTWPAGFVIMIARWSYVVSKDPRRCYLKTKLQLWHKVLFCKQNFLNLVSSLAFLVNNSCFRPFFFGLTLIPSHWPVCVDWHLEKSFMMYFYLKTQTYARMEKLSELYFETSNKTSKITEAEEKDMVSV